MFHNSLDIHEIKELRLNTLVSFGCGTIRKIEEIAAALEKRGVRSLPAAGALLKDEDRGEEQLTLL